MKKAMVVMVLTLVAGWGLGSSQPPAAGERAAAAPPRNGPPPMLNLRVDLLDQDVLLVGDTDQAVWASATFDTSRFELIGLRVYGEASGVIECSVAWQFIDDDAFEPSVPWIRITGGPGPVLDIVPVSDTEVRGTRAKVICEAVRSFWPPGGESSSGILTDVKVLLRHG